MNNNPFPILETNDKGQVFFHFPKTNFKNFYDKIVPILY